MKYSEWSEARKEKQREYSRKWYQANSEKARESARERRKKQGASTRTKKDDATKKIIRRMSYQKWLQSNRDKAYSRIKKWQHEHPEYVREMSRKRRARKHNLDKHFSQYEWKLLCAEYDHRCLKCGQKKTLSPDHVVPLVCGGADTIDNIQPLCLSCNVSKGARSMTDYRNREPIKIEQLSFLEMTQ